MYNPYVTSTLSIRYKGPVSYQFNECYYFPDYRTNTHFISSSQPCCCVCCSPNYVYTNPVNPRILCGSRQSSLIHWSVSRRVLIPPVPDDYCCQAQVRDPCGKCCCGYVKDRGFCRKCCCGYVKDRGFCRKCCCGYVKDRGFCRKCCSGYVKDRNFRRMVSEGRSCDFENAEMMLSLLIEEVGEERYGVRERDCSSLRRVEFETKGSDSDRYLRKKKEKVGSGLLRRSSRDKYEGLRIESRENEAKSSRKEGRMIENEEVVRSEKRGMKSGSSCSSYYTCSTLGEDSETDSEIHVRNEACAEESGVGYKRDTIESGNAVYEGEIKENLRRHESVIESHKMIESDWRKKSEKKLDEVAIGDVCETSHNRDSTYKQCDTVDNKSKTLISESGTRQQYSQKSGQVIGGSESTRKQKQFVEMCEDDAEAVSSSRKRFSGREEKSTVAGSYVLGEKHEHVKTDDGVSRRDDYRLSTQQSNPVSQLEDTNVKRTNISQSQNEDKVKREEDRFSGVLSLVQDTEKRYYLKSDEDSRKMDSRRKFQQSSEISDDHVSRRDEYRSSTERSNQVSQIQDMNVRRTNISKAQYEDKVERREDQTSVISSSVQDPRNQYYLKSEDDLRQMDSRGKFRRSAEISDDRVSRRDDYRLSTKQSDEVSQIQDTTVRRTDISRAQYEDKAKRREGRSSVISSSVQDTENRFYLQTEEDLRQMDTRRKSQQSMEISAQVQDVQTNRQVSKRDSRKGFLDMSTITLGRSSDTQVTNTHKTSENRISSQETNSSMVVRSTEESKKRTETSDNRVLRFESTTETGVTSNKASSLQASLVLEATPTMGDDSNSQAILIPPQSRILSTSYQSGYHSDALYTTTQLNSPSSTAAQTQKYDDPLTSISHEDTLGSAHRFQISSSKIVGEFLEKVTHEASTSHRQMEESTSIEEMLGKGRKHEEKSSSEYVDVDFKSKDQESRRSSGSSGVKGPSDEIWDEVAQSTEEPINVQIQVPEVINPSQNIVVKRTGRSLWNVISDIVRLPWSSRSKTSTPKSGVRNSPNQSTRSEAWFSSHDRDETSDENMKRINKSMSHESIPTPTQYQGEGYSSSSSKDNISRGKTPIGSTTPKGSSSVSSEENFKMGASTTMETSVSMPSLRIRRSPNVDDVAEVDKRTIISASGSLTGKEQVTVSSPINVKGSEAKVGGDMKRRMLQRTNQVIKDRFDEWEETFTLETEQRKIDEAFMREALLEAKKAGDMWEVPVGAVLVQHGKIIARGYNLVEELRDSTAHAEMICIREGSNQLRTWRLADTTLYVTLEPCPMCAGAILQARVDTVVWGAPNKLLGADGSWIRLFPGGGEGGTSLDSTDKPPAPVHPFHPKILIRRGVLGTECADVMQQFFQLRRRKKDKKQLLDTPPIPPSCLPISNHPTKILDRMQDAFHFMFCL